MLWWVIGIVLGYCLIGSLVGGFIHQVKNRQSYPRWGNDDSGFVGAGWPISLLWYLILKPMTRVGTYIAEAQERRQEKLQKIREELEAVERTRQLEIQKHLRELEEEEAEYQARHQASA